MPSRNKFERHGDEIYISRDAWDQIAMTTYREDYYEELTSVTWTANRGYLTNNRLGLVLKMIKLCATSTK